MSPAATASSMIRGLVPETEPGRAVCAVVDELSGFLADEAAANDAEGRFARASVEKLRQTGVLAACAPVEDGGFGLESLYDLAVVVSRLAEADASVAIAATMHFQLTSYFARSVRKAAPHERDGLPMRDWVRTLGKREMVVCSAVAEPGVEPWQVRSTARPDGDGGGWRIDGRKVMASASPAATHFYGRFKAETGDGPRMASVMIPADTPGVTVRETWNGLGLRGSGSGQVLFDDVRLPAEAVALRGAWGVQLNAYDGRAAQAAPTVAAYLGIAEAARRLGLDALASGDGRERGGSVGVGSLVAEMEVKIAGARAALHTALRTLDAAITDTAPRTRPADEGRRLLKECVIAGLIVERAAFDVVDLAMQLCGGRSFVQGHPLGRLYRDVRGAAFMRPWAPAEQTPDFLAAVTFEELAESGETA